MVLSRFWVKPLYRHKPSQPVTAEVKLNSFARGIWYRVLLTLPVVSAQSRIRGTLASDKGWSEFGTINT
jgi:hypothetical protein